MKSFIRKAILANINYLQKLAEFFSGKEIRIQDYKLLRKDVYVSEAGFSAAFQRMQSEPRSKQQYSEEIQRLVVLSHILSSNISAVFSTLLAKNETVQNAEYEIMVIHARSILETGIQKLGLAYHASEHVAPDKTAKPLTAIDQEEDHLIRQQLAFIMQLARDSEKIVGEIVG